MAGGESEEAGRQPARMNPNVRLTLFFAALLSMASSLLTQTPLAAFILLVRHNNHLSVGVATGLQVAAGPTPPNPFLEHTALSGPSIRPCAMRPSARTFRHPQGLVSLCFALPASAWADRIGRQALLRLAALVGFVATIYTAVCLLILRTRLSDDGLYYCLCGTSVLWGMFMGLHGAPLEALFGDSVESGKRPRCDLG